MKFLSVMICIALLVFLGQEAVTLHKLTVCRQEAWRSSVELHTGALLTRARPLERSPLPRCRVLVSRNEREVSWRRFPVARKHVVPLFLRGRL